MMRTEEITNRLKRIEGQVRGLQRMVGEERECEAILTQVMAARAAASFWSVAWRDRSALATFK